MAVRSLNKVQLIGNLTRDPELRFTPQGTAVCSFGLATNRSWTTDSGDGREETEFHRIVAWAKLAELCSQLLFKGRRIYVEGRLQTRKWTAQDGSPRSTTEIVIDDMIILDSKHKGGGGDYDDYGDGGNSDYTQGPDNDYSPPTPSPKPTPSPTPTPSPAPAPATQTNDNTDDTPTGEKTTTKDSDSNDQEDDEKSDIPF